jgi:hypothetical protein
MKRSQHVFPREAVKSYSAFGLTKRELFSAIALAGILADGEKLHTIAARDAIECADILIGLLDTKEEGTRLSKCEITGYDLNPRA